MTVRAIIAYDDTDRPMGVVIYEAANRDNPFRTAIAMIALEEAVILHDSLHETIRRNKKVFGIPEKTGRGPRLQFGEQMKLAEERAKRYRGTKDLLVRRPK